MSESPPKPLIEGARIDAWFQAIWKWRYPILALGSLGALLTAYYSLMKIILKENTCVPDESDDDGDSDTEEEAKKINLDMKVMEESEKLAMSIDAANDIWCYYTFWRPLLKKRLTFSWHYFYSQQRTYFQHELLFPTPIDFTSSESFFKIIGRSIRAVELMDDDAKAYMREHSSEVRLAKGEYLFKIDDPNDRLFYIQSGKIQMKINIDGKVYVVRNIKPGRTICSCLSLVNVITNQTRAFTTIEAKATEDSVVISIPLILFREIWKDQPELLVKAVRTQFHRFFQIFFVALHNVLGLGKDLFVSQLKPRAPEDVLTIDEMSPEFRIRAIEAAKRKLKISKEDDILDDVGVGIFDAGTILVENNAQSREILFIFYGELELSTVGYKGDVKESLFNLGDGEIIGCLLYLCDEESVFTITAIERSLIVIIPEHILELVVEKYPECVFYLMDAFFRRLSPFSRQLDYAIQWGFFKYSELIYKSGDFPEATYLVISGRLRSLRLDDHGKPSIFGEYRTNDWIGLVEVLTNRSRTKSVMAVRDTELAIIPNGVLKVIKYKFPSVTNRLLEFLGERIAKKSTQDLRGIPPCVQFNEGSDSNTGIDYHSLVSSAIALIPLNSEAPIRNFGRQLVDYFNQISPGDALLLTKEDFISKLLTRYWNDQDLTISTSWLSKLERKYKHIIFLGDLTPSDWNSKFIRNVDEILLLANSDDPNRSIREIEDFILKQAPIARKELLLFHKENKNFKGATVPIRTKSWLRRRPWLSMHHHLHLEQFSGDPELEEDDGAYDDARSILISPNSEIARIGRWLSGSSTGLVLGGGGAKGAAHIGMLENVIEKGIPIDMIGGVGTGALISAFYAIFMDIGKTRKETLRFFKERTDRWRYIWENAGIPYGALYRGTLLNNLLKETFKNIKLEDLWLPYFCVSTDLSASKARIHRCGPVWRYMRATKNKANQYPPICDPIDGHWLMSGEYIKLAPADTMKYDMGARYIIAVDISKEAEYNYPNFGDHLSGVSVMFHKLVPFVEPTRIPSALEILEILGLIQSSINLDITKSRDSNTVYIHPPVSSFRTDDYTRFFEIKELSYNYGIKVFSECARPDPDVKSPSVDELWGRINCGNYDAEEKLRNQQQQQARRYFN